MTIREQLDAYVKGRYGIRRHYAGEESPLSKVIESDKAFYDLFVDFKGYVDFFFMQDCVSEDYSSVKIWIGDASFKKSGLPETVEEYLQFLVKEHVFLDKRNRRIQEYSLKHNRSYEALRSGK